MPKGSIARLEILEKELAELKDRSAGMRAQWENEKSEILEAKNLKQQIEDIRLEIEDAERQADYEKGAKLKYGVLPDLERQLEEKKAAADKRAAEKKVAEDKKKAAVKGSLFVMIEKCRIREERRKKR